MENGLHKISYSDYKAWPKQSQAEYMEGASLANMINDDLAAGRISIDGCREIIHYLRDQGSLARHPLEDILTFKGQRASDAVNRLASTASGKVRAALESGSA